jgi:hypothetical protein
LRRASPAGSNEALLKAKLVPKRNASGTVEFVGAGKKTVDVQQIKERFEGLGIIGDWARFKRISTARNDIEHYFTAANKKALESLISDSFVLVRNLVTTQLSEDPLELLGPDTWNAMLEISEVYETERKECEASLHAVNWESGPLAQGVLGLTCPSCGSNLLRPNGEYSNYEDDMFLSCHACGELLDADTFVPDAVGSVLQEERYYADKEGGETPLTNCPECGAEAYVMDEERCARCGESAEHNCIVCGNKIPAEELLCSPYCGWCDHVRTKDD